MEVKRVRKWQSSCGAHVVSSCRSELSNWRANCIFLAVVFFRRDSDGGGAFNDNSIFTCLAPV
jgi:hypothetical protein